MLRSLLIAALSLSLMFTSVGSWASAQDERVLGALYNSSVIKADDSESVTARVSAYAHYFLAQKSPYIVDPLGEGEKGEFSQKPLYRFDGFDCTTFVETVLALSFSHSPLEFKSTLNKIRYKNGVVSYETRNHFPSVDWIPNNTKAGFVKDITGEIGGNATRWSQTWIEKDNWFSMKGVDYKKVAARMGKTLGRLPYLGKEDLRANPALMERIPDVAIFHVVRPNWNLKKAIGTELDVSHEGFLIRENGVVYMIHASNGLGRDGSDNYKGVKKEALLSYIERVMMSSPSMAGINILRIQQH